MSYPTTIPNSFQGYDLTSCNRGDNCFLTEGGARYLFARQGGFAAIDSAPPPYFASGDILMHAFKSTDNGLTWTDKGAADNGSYYSLPGGYGGIGPILRDSDGTTVWWVGITISSAPATTGLKIFKFDLGTDTWDSGTTYTAPLPIRDTSVPGPLAKLLQFSDGSYALVYNGAKETISGIDYARIYYCTFDGSTFGTPVMMPGQSGNPNKYYFVDAIVDALDVVHILYTNIDTTDSANRNICHKSLDGATWSAEQAIAYAGPYNLPDSWSNFAIYGSTIAFCGQHDDLSANGQLVYYYASLADSPTWNAAPIADISQSQVPLGNFTGVNGKVWGLTAYGSTLCIVEALSVSANPPGGQVFYRTASTSTPTLWSSDTLLIDTPAVTQSGATNAADGYGAHAVAAYPDAGGIAVVAEWECRFTPDSGAENMQFTFLTPTPPTGGIGNIFSYPNCGAQVPGNYFL